MSEENVVGPVLAPEAQPEAPTVEDLYAAILQQYAYLGTVERTLESIRFDLDNLVNRLFYTESPNGQS